MISLNKCLTSFLCISTVCCTLSAYAEFSFVPPNPDAFKKAIKTFPGRKHKHKDVAKNEEVYTPKIAADDLHIDLKEPTFTQGVIKTDQGGVISSDGLRIQAQKIEYTNKIENGVRIQKIIAEGDLMMEFGGRYFVGEKLEFDLTKNTGTLWQGRTDVDVWFVGGEKIELLEDGSYFIYNAFITTCESQDNLWEINSESVKISKEHVLSANNIRFKFFKVPVFWLPAFKSNLKLFSDSPIKYKLTWDKGLGPRASFRYRILSWQDLNIFFRLDYRLSRGFGAAVESEYYSPDDRTVFITRSYGAHDKIVPEEKSPKRYRLQGLLSHQSLDKKTFLHLQYDKYSDLQMIDDFRSSDFVIDTQKRTRLLINHQENNVFGTLTFQPQINNFESISEQLPLIIMGVKPFVIGNTGIISDNYINAGYQKYIFAQSVHDPMPATHAGRLETRNKFYRPIGIGPLTLTPAAGVIGIFYSNNPLKNEIGQLAFSYGAELSTQIFRSFKRQTHRIEPYINYLGLTKPRVDNINHYTFSMHDGLYKLNQLKIGARNYFFSNKLGIYQPSFYFDLYTNTFFSQNRYNTFFPKAYATMSWNQPTYALISDFAWNFQEQILDYINTRADITVNEDLAFGLEYRHRSKYDWRKANHQSFILEMSHSIDSLLDSPLSDRRDTFLSRMQLRISPKWTLHVESIQGWKRKKDPSYSAVKTDIVTLLPCNWQLRFSYSHTPDDDRFTTQLQLTK
jgi:hypothetical protein